MEKGQTLNDLKSRYLNDPIFHCVVDHMRSIIRAATLTPSEVREAAMTACVIEEQYNPRPPFSTSDEELEIVRRALELQHSNPTQSRGSKS